MPSRRNLAPPVRPADWPDLPHSEWADTLATLHMWLQIVGKIRMELSPWRNHSWNVPLYVTARGLTTSPLRWGPRDFKIDFDFIDHQLIVAASDSSVRRLRLEPRTVASFYEETMAVLGELGCGVKIHAVPNETPDPIPFAEDTKHASYDREHVAALWAALRHTARVMDEFQAQFIGKVSPVHLFWGAPDLAVTRFSGRPAPPHPGGIPHLPDAVTREAYSHEVSSCGFWPGGGDTPPAFYSYAYPTPEGFAAAKVEPAEAFWSKDMGEFLLPYDAVKGSSEPDETLHRFFETTYAAAADLAEWDRQALERPRGYRPLAED